MCDLGRRQSAGSDQHPDSCAPHIAVLRPFLAGVRAVMARSIGTSPTLATPAGMRSWGSAVGTQTISPAGSSAGAVVASVRRAGMLGATLPPPHPAAGLARQRALEGRY